MNLKHDLKLKKFLKDFTTEYSGKLPQPSGSLLTELKEKSISSEGNTMKMETNSTYYIDDNFDDKNHDSQASEANSTVVLLSFLLALLVFILGVIFFYFYRRCRADQESEETENSA